MDNYEGKFAKSKFIIMAIALWLMISAFIIGNNKFTQFNAIITGLAFIFLAFRLSNWQRWMVFAAGILLLIISFFPPYYSTYINVISGATNTQINKSTALTWNIIIGIITLLAVFVPPKIED